MKLTDSQILWTFWGATGLAGTLLYVGARAAVARIRKS